MSTNDSLDPDDHGFDHQGHSPDESKAAPNGEDTAAAIETEAKPKPPSDKGQRGSAVGRNKPPKEGQFKPGQSGNPRGRPKRSKNLRTMVREVMTQKVTLRTKGKRTTVTAAQAALNKALGRALDTGNVRDTIALFQLAERYGLAADDAGPAGLAPLTAAEEADLADFLRRAREGRVGTVEDAPEPAVRIAAAGPIATGPNAAGPADDTPAAEVTTINPGSEAGQ